MGIVAACIQFPLYALAFYIASKRGWGWLAAVGRSEVLAQEGRPGRLHKAQKVRLELQMRPPRRLMALDTFTAAHDKWK